MKRIFLRALGPAVAENRKCGSRLVGQVMGECMLEL